MEEITILQTINIILEEAGVTTDLIETELTESVFADWEDVNGGMCKLGTLSITVSIHDFGTGYSAFSYIKELLADTI